MLDESPEYLVLRIAAGNQAAMTLLHNNFASRIFNIARRLGLSTQCAQEIVCDVFNFVWHNAGEYDPARASVSGWLAVIARHRAIDLWRRNGRHRFFTDRGGEDCQAVEWQSPEWLLAQRQQHSIVHAALNKLPPLRRRLLMLAFFDGLSHDEIAAGVGMPLGTVKSHLRRGLLAMRSALTLSVVAPAV